LSILFFAAALSSSSRLLAEWRPGPTSRAYLGMAGPGFVLIIGVMFALGFPEAAEELGELALPAPWRSPWFMASTLSALLLWGLLWGRRFKLDGRPALLESAMLAGLLLLIVLMLVPLNNVGEPLAMLFNLLFLAAALLLIVKGAREQHGSLLRIGIGMVILLAAVRYLDLFDSLLARALAFFITGGLLFIGGLLFRRSKRQEAEP